MLGSTVSLPCQLQGEDSRWAIIQPMLKCVSCSTTACTQHALAEFVYKTLQQFAVSIMMQISTAYWRAKSTALQLLKQTIIGCCTVVNITRLVSGILQSLQQLSKLAPRQSVLFSYNSSGHYIIEVCDVTMIMCDGGTNPAIHPLLQVTRHMLAPAKLHVHQGTAVLCLTMCYPSRLLLAMVYTVCMPHPAYLPTQKCNFTGQGPPYPVAHLNLNKL